MYGYIYITENKVNGKKYIGKHKAESFDQNYFGSGKAIQRAINKYGIENFECNILSPINNIPTMCFSEEELNNSEIYYIDFYDCVKSENYYNMKSGGIGGWGELDFSGENNGMYGRHRTGELNPNYGKRHTFTEEQRRRMSEAHKGKKRKTPISIETREKMSKACKKRVTTEETRKKMSVTRKGKKHSAATKELMSKNNAMHKPGYRQRVSEALKGRESPCKNTIWMHKNLEQRMVKFDQITKYEKLGFMKGRK